MASQSIQGYYDLGNHKLPDNGGWLAQRCLLPGFGRRVLYNQGSPERQAVLMLVLSGGGLCQLSLLGQRMGVAGKSGHDLCPGVRFQLPLL